jgi:5'-deoxynucleotidase YfbR-like HD superfamily hydrolase
MSNFHPEMLDPRQAGELRRYHTWACNHEQTVADHSWNVARLLLAWDPQLPRHMLVHALFHDIGERITGDVPYPIKAQNPALKKEMDRLEFDGHLAMCGPWGVSAPVALSDAEAALFKLADLVDMWEHALDEIARGNKHCRLVRERTQKAISDRLGDPESLISKSIVIAARQYVARRIKHEETYHG